MSPEPEGCLTCTYISGLPGPSFPDFYLEPQPVINIEACRIHPKAQGIFSFTPIMAMSEADAAAAQLIYPQHALANTNTLASIKFLSSCAAGMVAGVLGLENQYGFALFTLSSLITGFAVYIIHVAERKATASTKATRSSTIDSFVRGGIWEIVNPGQDNVFSFVLLWTLFYGKLSQTT